MRIKYPKKPSLLAADEEMLTPVEQLAQSFHAPNAEAVTPQALLQPPTPTAGAAAGAAATTAASQPAQQQPWGVGHMRLSPTAAAEASLAKRLTMLMLASLRASGTFRLDFS